MEMASFKLEISSSNSEASTMKKETYSGYNSLRAMLVNQILDNLNIRSHNYLCSKADVMTKKKRYRLLSDNDDSLHLWASSLNRRDKKSYELNERVRSLEEEYEVIKQAFLESMEERKKLTDEIYQQFKDIRRCCLGHRDDQVTGEKFCDVALVISPFKEGRRGTGLSQVLYHEPHPSLVFTNIRSNPVAFPPSN